MTASVMLEPSVIKAAAIEVRPVVPVEIRTIVFIVDPVTVVAIPNGIVVIHIPGELGLIDDGGRRRSITALAITVLTIIILVILVLAYWCRGRRRILLINYGRRRGRSNINPTGRDVEPDMDRYLRVSRSSDQGTGKDCGKYK